MNSSDANGGSPPVVSGGVLSAIFFVLLLAFPVYVLRFRIFGNGTYLDSQPWVGWKDESYSYLKGILRCIQETSSIVAEGYDKYSKHGKAFVFASVPSGPVLILPNSQLKDALYRQDTEIDGNEALNNVIQIKYTVSEKAMYENKFHFNIIRKQLTRNLTEITPMIAEEIELALKDYWGSDTEWHNVDAAKSMLRVMARVTSRMFYGPELCRNEEFLDHIIAYSGNIVNGGAFINLSPTVLKPLVGQMMRYVGKNHLNKARVFSIPFVEDRLRQTQRKINDPSYDWEAPFDGLQWLIDECYKAKDPEKLTAPSIAHRLLILSMMAVDSTGLTTVQALLDIYSSPPEDGVVAGLHEEIKRILSNSGGTWTKDAVDKLVRTDSTLRESMRYSCFGLINFPRRVVSPGGVTLEDGTHIPQGVRVAAAMDAIHRDAAFYSAPNKFDAFRFSRANEDADSKEGEDGVGDKVVTSTTVSDKFLTFGYGRHACPGRFFATQEIKLIIANALMNYEVIPFEERPRNKIFLEFKVPEEGLALTVRRIAP